MAMDEVAHKRAAVVLSTRRTEVLVAPPGVSRFAFEGQVRRLEKRGEVRALSPRAVWSSDREFWEMRVVRLRRPTPSWRKPLAIAAAAITALSILAGLSYWALSTLATTPTAALLATVLVFFLAALPWKRSGREVITETVVQTRTRVR